MKSLKEHTFNFHNNNHILLTVGYYDLFNDVNESFFDKFTSDEAIKQNLDDILIITSEIKRLTLSLVKKTSIRLVKLVYKQFTRFKRKFKSSHDFRISVMLSLLVLVLGPYNYIKTYNENPVISNSKIEKNNDLITFTDKNDTVQFSVSDIEHNKLLTNYKDYNYKTSIRVLQEGETAPDYYKGSPELKTLIAEKMEGCILHIYSTSAGNPVPKSRRDMLNMTDLTIGYGHKLTKEERKTWNFNKTLTKEEAWELFIKDYTKHEEVANEFIKRLPYYDKVEFGQGFIDAIISIRYNSSKELLLKYRPEFWDKLSNCTLEYFELNPEEFNEALESVKSLWANKEAANGLAKRRQVEYDIMKQPFGTLDKKLYTQDVY